MTTHVPTSVHWFRSSYSNDQGGNCVEGARLDGVGMAVRDSKALGLGACPFPAAAWTTFVTAITSNA
ncbi:MULTISPECIES: DUF397 domain-containing protein [unclassified Streptomyces]|uniref:DUF397 domain-containing protein n=1 Tax=unclassified Streptomyces TaxID=2593676 RepID=UPI00332FAD5A